MTIEPPTEAKKSVKAESEVEVSEMEASVKSDQASVKSGSVRSA